jgi:hypothetical protein
MHGVSTNFTNPKYSYNRRYLKLRPVVTIHTKIYILYKYCIYVFHKILKKTEVFP